MSLFNITYFGSALPEYTKAELLKVLKESRTRNEALGITGILLYRDGNILQVLEGEESAVRSVYQGIAADPRHVGLFPAIQEPVEDREFPDWTMAFRDLSLDAHSIEGFNEILNSWCPESALALAPSKSQTFLLSFLKRSTESEVFVRPFKDADSPALSSSLGGHEKLHFLGA